MTEDALTQQMSAADLEYQTFAPLAASLRQACGVATGVPIIMAATPLAVDSHVDDSEPSTAHWCLRVYFK